MTHPAASHSPLLVWLDGGGAGRRGGGRFRAQVDFMCCLLREEGGVNAAAAALSEGQKGAHLGAQVLPMMRALPACPSVVKDGMDPMVVGLRLH